MPGYGGGGWWVQDAAASLPALAATTNPRKARIAFAGFGDPVFSGPADGSGEVELTAMLSEGMSIISSMNYGLPATSKLLGVMVSGLV